jgi:alpha-D-ribose 1-methylphosphonate 5-triphosphate diphosphatase
MSRQSVFTNARLVLDDEVVAGSIAVAAGRIEAIDPGATAAPGAIDVEGDYLIPGLVELHTDHVEAHAFPRPNVRWPIMPAVLAHDAAIASAGITTVFDAIAVGHDAGKAYRRDLCDDVLAALDRAASDDQLRAEHRVHLRCEITVAGMAEQFERNREDPRVGLVSIMDHTPGQRQFVDLDKYREYYGGKYGVDQAELERHIADSRERQATYAEPHRRCVIDWCRKRGLPLASHDDATGDDVARAAAAGAILAEFPTTEDAAHAAREYGMGNILGAPNMVRGGSHSGNVAATELAERGLIDVFSSDYVPASLLHAGWLLTEHGYDLPRAIATISATPAGLLGLDDRGRLAPGLRADLVRVRAADHGPVVRGVWREGRAVA